MDPIAGLDGFTAASPAAGLPFAAQRVQAYLGAFGHIAAAQPTELYWAGRLTLCAEPDDLPRYDDAFTAWFGGPPPGRPRTTTARRIRLSTIATLDGAAPGRGEGR